MRDEVIQTESWSQFHQKHHSEKFHYSASNELFLQRNSHSCLSCCYIDDSDEHEKSWFSGLLDVLFLDSSAEKRRQHTKALGDDDSSMDSGGSGRMQKLRIPTLRNKKKERRKGNIKLSNFSR